MTRPVAVYRFFNGDNALLYIGTACRPFTRFDQHAAEKDWMREVACMRVQWFDSQREANIAEAEAIRDESPRYNRASMANTLEARNVIGPGPDMLKEWIAENRMKSWHFDASLGLPTSKMSHVRVGRQPPAPDVAAKIESLTDGFVPASAWTIRDGVTVASISFDPPRPRKARRKETAQ